MDAADLEVALVVLLVMKIPSKMFGKNEDVSVVRFSLEF